MAAAPALSRAQAVLTTNKYFALATIDEAGPWVATLAYVVVQPRHLCFFSEAASRHGAAIAAGSAAAGVIYDSRCEPADAESLQFSGTGEILRGRDQIAEVLRTAAIRDGSPQPSEESIDEAVAKESTLVYRITLKEAYVLDQDLFASEGIDGREPVDVAEVFSGLR